MFDFFIVLEDFWKTYWWPIINYFFPFCLFDSKKIDCIGIILFEN